jgi:hypothetical protein
MKLSPMCAMALLCACSNTLVASDGGALPGQDGARPSGQDGSRPTDCSALTCDAHATCSVRGSTPTCTCNAGYSGDGATCTEIASTGGCDALGAVGEWQLITPPTYVDPETCGFGVQDVAVDPLHPGTVYLGTCQGGIYKSTQCGARDSWVLINTGRDVPTCWGASKSCAQALGEGRQWSLEIDPVDSNVLYAANGFGTDVPWGLFKSTDGGVNWSIVWPVAQDDSRWDASFTDVPGFAGSVYIDPGNHEHILLSFHESCGGTHTSLCIAESEDSGGHWRIVDGDPRMQGYSPHDTALYLLDSDTWIQSTQGNGQGQVWRTANRGASWAQVELDDIALGGMMRRRDGSFLWGGNYNLFSSTDVGASWSGTEARAVNSMTYIGARIVRSTFASCHNANFPNGDADPYTVSSNDGQTWEAFPHPTGIHQGGALNFDATNHVLYSNNCQDGFWRVRTE